MHPDTATGADPVLGEERQHVLALLRAFGWNTTSFQILGPGFRYWFDGERGCVAYVDTGRAWVAAGAPVAAPERLSLVADRFVSAARAEGRSAVLFATEPRFVASSDYPSLRIGEQPIWDPQAWQARLEGHPRLREQLRRARAKGVRVEAVEAHQLCEGAPLRLELEALIAAWMRTRPMPSMGFLVRVDPFRLVEERRLFVARGPGPAELLGFATMVPVYARQGWFVEDLIRSPGAPNGTVELLVDAAMRDAASLGSRYLTLGLSPLAGAVAPPLRLASRLGASLYDFRGLHAFKAKFRPDGWAPVYLSLPERQSAALALYHSLRAFAERSLVRFGLETALRGPGIVICGLAAALIPWIALLASLDGPRWFPAPWVQWAWVTFDLALCAGLFALGARFRRRLSAILLGLVIGDVVLTSVQALAFNLPHSRTAADVLGTLVGLAAPALATVILANAHRRRSVRERTLAQRALQRPK